METTLSVSHTILIPTKDRPVLLTRAVKSALNALGQNGEILVVDDHSSPPVDKTLDVFDDPRIRIVINDGASGVSAARNSGMRRARGQIVFFLDDDDEIHPTYCREILNAVDTSTPPPDYGFCAYDMVTDTADHTIASLPHAGKIRFRNGFIPDNASIKKRTFGFGMGFWVRREVFDDIGPIDEAISMNEDTEYSCRLITCGKVGWYSDQPGMLIHSHTGRSDLGQITKRTEPSERSRCFLHLYQKYPDMRGHLGVGYLKHVVKSGQFRTAWDFAGSQSNICHRMQSYALIIVKYIGYRLTGKMTKPDQP